MRLAALILLSVTAIGQEPTPKPLSTEDHLDVCQMTVEGLKAALLRKDAEVKMLRARLEMDRLDAEAQRHQTAINVKEQSLKGKYQVPLGYVLMEDGQWKKGPGPLPGVQK